MALQLRHNSGGSNTAVYKKCRALYDCTADNPDELSFKEAEVIVVTNSKLYEDDNWMVSKCNVDNNFG